MPPENLMIQSQDGYPVPVYHWPHPQAQGVVHILHGMSEHARCYTDVAEVLHTAGFAVVAHDHRCHGLACPAEQLGRASNNNSFRALCDDVLPVNQSIRQWYPQRPLLLLGHSMGSFISQIFAQEHSDKIDALLLEGSNYAAPWYLALAGLIARFECWRQGDDAQSAVLNALSFAQFNRAFRPCRTDFDWLSRDSHFVDTYIADPLCGTPVSNLYWLQMLNAMVLMSKRSQMEKIRKDLPIYLFAGTRDPVGGFGKGVLALDRLLKKCGIHSVTTTLYPDARHDILHETCKEAVFTDMLRWMSKVAL